MCMVEYDVINEQQKAFGNHYLIAFRKNDEIKKHMKLLTDKTMFYLIKQYPCAFLKNYMIKSYDEMIFPNILRSVHCHPITLGKMVKKSSQHITDSEFNEQLNNLRAADMAKCLLKNVRWRLDLPLKYKKTTLCGNPNEAVNYAFAIISNILPALQAATEPLKIKEMMENLNDNLIKFVSNYYDYLRNLRSETSKIYNHDNIYHILDEINRCIKLQSYRSVKNVFCVVYDTIRDNNELVIYFTKENLDILLNVFKSKGFTTLKFIANEDQDDNWYVKYRNQKEKVSFTRLDLAKDPVTNNKATIAYEVSCVNNHDDNYHWICLECETLIKLTGQAKLVCNCGVTKLQAIVYPECLQCKITKNVQLEVCLAGNGTDDQIAETSGTIFMTWLTTTEPVTFSCTVNTTNATNPVFVDDIIETSDAIDNLSASFDTSQYQRPWVTILVIGRSESNNKVFIDSVYHGKLMELEQAAEHGGAENESVVMMENGCNINYGVCEVHFVNVVFNGRPIDWNPYPEVHGFIFVIENNSLSLPSSTEKDLRKMLGMVPKSGAKNCCIVNVTQTSTVSKQRALANLEKVANYFCTTHALDCDIKHVIVDSESLNEIKTTIEVFILSIAFSPVSYFKLKPTECLTRLGNTLLRNPSTNLENKRLMASVIEETMSETARLLRGHVSETDMPLSLDEWETAVFWKIDKNLIQIIREIHIYYYLQTNFEVPLTNVECTPGNLSKTNKSGEQTTTRTLTTQPMKNVLIIGSSAANKQMLLNHVNCVRRHENFDDAVNNAALITFQDSDDYVMDYGPHTIRYISRDELGMEEFDIHGCIIVVENNTMELSNATDNHIRNTFSRLPRRAVENCCIVNPFTPSDTFSMNDAEQQMRDLVTKFCGQHALANGPAFICVDTTSIEAILNHNVPADPSVYQSAYAVGKRGIEQFLVTIQTAQPITPGDLENSANWARLCDAFRSHRTCRDPEVLRLMATIAENCLTGLAIYCRKNKGDALPLRDDEWPAALSYWSPKDADIAATLQTLKQP